MDFSTFNLLYGTYCEIQNMKLDNKIISNEQTRKFLEKKQRFRHSKSLKGVK